MSIRKFLLFLITLIVSFSFCRASYAQPLPIATTYSQGIYDISEYAEDYIIAKLITRDKHLTVSLIAENGSQKMFLRFINVNEVIKLGPVQKGDVVVIIGAGEISFSPAKSSQ